MIIIILYNYVNLLNCKLLVEFINIIIKVSFWMATLRPKWSSRFIKKEGIPFRMATGNGELMHKYFPQHMRIER